MTSTQKQVASVEEFEKTLTFEHPIPVSWAVGKYKAQHELIEQLKEENQQLADKYNDMMYGLEAQLMQKDTEIEHLKDQRNRALAEWEESMKAAENLAEVNKRMREALELIKYAPSSHSYSRVIADNALSQLNEQK